jgi:hypothetical protein
MATNELILAKAFRDAGFPQDKAETVAETIFAAIRDNVATKSDVQLSAAELRREIGDVRREVQSVKLWLGGIVVAGFGIVLAAIGLLFAALHMWPPHT